MKIKIKLKDGVKLPSRATNGSSGFDLCSALENYMWSYPSYPVKIPTGISLEIPDGFEAQVRSRSGLSLRGIVAAAGTIDSDYRGEISVVIFNFGIDARRIHPGERIAQLVFAPVVIPELEIVEELSDTERGTSGFGSTGI